jgi:hypothetical protein
MAQSTEGTFFNVSNKSEVRTPLTTLSRHLIICAGQSEKGQVNMFF